MRLFFGGWLGAWQGANYLQLKFMRLPKSTKLNRLIKKPRAHTERNNKIKQH